MSLRSLRERFFVSICLNYFVPNPTILLRLAFKISQRLYLRAKGMYEFEIVANSR